MLSALLERIDGPPKRPWWSCSEGNGPKSVAQSTPEAQPSNFSVQKRARSQPAIIHFAEPDDSLSRLPPPTILGAVIDAYFDLVQPWIPILHEERFRERLSQPKEQASLQVIMHAMVVAVLSHIDSTILNLELDEIEKICDQSRKIVILTGMDNLIVENLQALTIVCFKDVGGAFISTRSGQSIHTNVSCRLKRVISPGPGLLSAL